MIIFHRGLPRSGKSYEAVKTMVSELIKGKQVFTNIDGINFKKFSQLTGIPERILKGDIFEHEILESDIDGYVQPLSPDDVNVNSDVLDGDFVNHFEPEQLEFSELKKLEELDDSSASESVKPKPEKPKQTYKGSEVYTRVYPVPEHTPSCPLCGMQMAIKKARDYKRHKDLSYLPNEFWGCINFPTCKGTRERLTITKYYVTKFSGLLFQLTGVDVPVIYSRVTDNSFVVIDEVQDYFPATSTPLPFPMTQFITQHGHRGINILLMGQDHNDCHNLFKRRIDKLIHFTKKDAVGMPNSYSWESYKLSVNGLVKLRSGGGKYESKFFGAYKSHVNDSVDASNHSDDRTNILKSSAFTFYLPLFIVALCFAVYYLIGFFSEPQFVKKAKVDSAQVHTVQSSNTSKPVQAPVVQSANLQSLASTTSVVPTAQTAPTPLADLPKTAATSDPADYFKSIADKYDIELSGLIEGLDKNGKPKVVALIDAFDSEHHLKERFQLEELVEMGWAISRKSYGFILSHGKQSYIIRQKPRDFFGHVAENVRYSPEMTGRR